MLGFAADLQPFCCLYIHCVKPLHGRQLSARGPTASAASSLRHDHISSYQPAFAALLGRVVRDPQLHCVRSPVPRAASAHERGSVSPSQSALPLQRQHLQHLCRRHSLESTAPLPVPAVGNVATSSMHPESAHLLSFSRPAKVSALPLSFKTPPTAQNQTSGPARYCRFGQ